MKDQVSFMGFAYPYTGAKAAIISAPYEGTSTYLKGQADGPKAIITASNFVETYDMELEEDYVDKICPHTLPELKMQKLPPKKAIDMLYEQTKKVFQDKKFPLIFGGEHSISSGPVRAAHEIFPGSLTVLQIDAHSDMRNEFEGSKYNHACVMARVREMVPAVSVGIRSQCKEEADIIRQKYSGVVFGADLSPASMDKILSKIRTKNVFITLDIDGFDPSIMPATGTPEPGGLLWNETLSLLRRVAQEKTVIGADIVELAPRKGDITSDFACALLAYKLLGYCLLD
ncbi:MAG: agmatinase [Candidatus Micrarchaeota archaeon]